MDHLYDEKKQQIAYKNDAPSQPNSRGWWLYKTVLMRLPFKRVLYRLRPEHKEKNHNKIQITLPN